MATAKEKKGIEKKSFLSKAKEKYNSNSVYKEDKYLFCGDAFVRATGLPGPMLNSLNMFLGHSNTGKTTALVKAAADAQKKGILPIFIITEKKWSWEHAQLLGLECERQANGSWDGFFLYKDDFQYIEQIGKYIVEVLDQLEKEKPDDIKGMLFLWDSIGSIPCKMTYEGKGGKMANASALADVIGMTVNSRITEARKEEYGYDLGLIMVNQPWVDIDMTNPMSQPEIKAKGGNAAYLAASLVFMFGKQKKAGVNQLRATKNKRSINFAIRTKLSVLKNHLNGISFTDGKLIATPHGFIDDNADAIKAYKDQYVPYWNQLFKMVDPDMAEDEDFEIDASGFISDED